MIMMMHHYSEIVDTQNCIKSDFQQEPLLEILSIPVFKCCKHNLNLYILQSHLKQ